MAACFACIVPSSGPVTLRLGHFANLTHATALVGLEKGLFAQSLGSNVTLKTSVFNAGPGAQEAILCGLKLEDWDCVAEGHEMLAQIRGRLGKGGGRWQ